MKKYRYLHNRNRLFYYSLSCKAYMLLNRVFFTNSAPSDKNLFKQYSVSNLLIYYFMAKKTTNIKKHLNNFNIGFGYL